MPPKLNQSQGVIAYMFMYPYCLQSFLGNFVSEKTASLALSVQSEPQFQAQPFSCVFGFVKKSIFLAILSIARPRAVRNFYYVDYA